MCYNVTMLQKNEYLKPDARGRVLLPKELRQIPLFEIAVESGQILLTPLRVEPMLPEQWLKSETDQFLSKKLLPSLKKYFAKERNIEIKAAVLFGSRAKGTALTGSDFDVALLASPYPGFRRRNEILDDIQEMIEPLQSQLRENGVNDDISFVFLHLKPKVQTVPDVYKEVANDGRLIWQQKDAWKSFVKKWLK